MHREPHPIRETGTGLRSLGGPLSPTPAGRVTLSPKELYTTCTMAGGYGLSLFPGRGYNPIAILKLSGNPFRAGVASDELLLYPRFQVLAMVFFLTVGAQ